MNEQETIEDVDPFTAHFHREPMDGAGVRIVLISDREFDQPPPSVAPIIAWLEQSGRPVELRTVIGRSAIRANERRSGTRNRRGIAAPGPGHDGTGAVDPRTSGPSVRGHHSQRPCRGPPPGGALAKARALGRQSAAEGDLRGSVCRCSLAVPAPPAAETGGDPLPVRVELSRGRDPGQGHLSGPSAQRGRCTSDQRPGLVARLVARCGHGVEAAQLQAADARSTVSSSGKCGER